MWVPYVEKDEQNHDTFLTRHRPVPYIKIYCKKPCESLPNNLKRKFRKKYKKGDGCGQTLRVGAEDINTFWV